MKQITEQHLIECARFCRYELETVKRELSSQLNHTSIAHEDELLIQGIAYAVEEKPVLEFRRTFVAWHRDG